MTQYPRMTQGSQSRAILGVAAVIGLWLPLGAQTIPARQPLARIGDQTIYAGDLQASIGAQLLQLKNQEYELYRNALTNLLNQRVLEDEATRKGLSAAALLDQVDRSVRQPTASEIETYYLAQKASFHRPLIEVRMQVEQALVQAKRQQARQDYLEQLRQNAGVAILLTRPRVDVTVDPLRLRGNPDAPVTIVEFADFECPYSQLVEQSLKEVLEKYKGRARLGFRDFPLSHIHPQAQQAAEASRCAGEQGKFWEYHDLLFATQGKLDLAGLTDQARAAGLELERFTACLSGGKFKTSVNADLQIGMASGVTGTPAFYINGVPLSGAQSPDAFELIIESELAENGLLAPGNADQFSRRLQR